MRLFGRVLFSLLSVTWTAQAFGMCEIVFKVHPTDPSESSSSIASRVNKDTTIVVSIDREGLFELDSKALSLLANESDLLGLGDRIADDFYERRILESPEPDSANNQTGVAFHINAGREIKTAREARVSQIAFSHSLAYKPEKADFFNTSELNLEDIAFYIRYSWIMDFARSIGRPESESLKLVASAASALFSEHVFERWRRGEGGAMRKLARLAPGFVKMLLTIPTDKLQKLTNPSFLNRDELAVMFTTCVRDKFKSKEFSANPFEREKARRDSIQSNATSMQPTTDNFLESWLVRALKNL